jgi:hypothetical protein
MTRTCSTARKRGVPNSCREDPSAGFRLLASIDVFLETRIAPSSKSGQRRESYLPFFKPPPEPKKKN